MYFLTSASYSCPASWEEPLWVPANLWDILLLTIFWYSQVKHLGDSIQSWENGENVITEKICINAEMIMHIRTEESILGANEDFDWH